MEKTIIFDIETGSLPAAELAAVMPPFDPMDVKLGNLKDEVKIRTKIEEARSSHVADITAGAALDPMLAKVLAIGIYAGNGAVRILGHGLDEDELIAHFWSECRGDSGRLNTLVGFRSNSFDLPFLRARSWALGISIPFGLRKGRYWSDQCVDLQETWQQGDRYRRGTLDAVGRFLGVGSKTVGVSGADFARLWVDDRPKAVEYLTQDILLTVRVAERLGAVAVEGKDY